MVLQAPQSRLLLRKRRFPVRQQHVLVALVLLIVFFYPRLDPPTAAIVADKQENHGRLDFSYAQDLSESLATIHARADDWLSNRKLHYQRAFSDSSLQNRTHARFFPFDPLASCQTIDCIGGPCGQDESKQVCGLERLRQRKNCVVYSIGSDNFWGFEIDLLRRTRCEVHTFDCTGPASRFTPPRSNKHHFHHVCLGPRHEKDNSHAKCLKCGETWTLQEMQDRLGHKHVDLLKMDIEGHEWPVFESWSSLSNNQIDLPRQIVVEMHYRDFTAFPELGNFGQPPDMVTMQRRLLHMGYVGVVRDDNPHCPVCTELTLIRTRPPLSGVVDEKEVMEYQPVKRSPGMGFSKFHSGGG